MGAFLLVKETTQFDKKPALQVFTTMGLAEPVLFSIAGWHIWSFKKIRSNENHFVQQGDALLVCAGTVIYKGASTFSESLQLILADLLKGDFNFNNIRGTYSLIFSPDGKAIKLLTDQSGVANIYYNLETSVISTSFLAVIFALKQNVTLNRMAAIEIITNGRQIGPDTLFNEINRVEISLMNCIGELELINDRQLQDFPPANSDSFRQSVEEQVEVLNDYFEDIKKFGNHYGVDSGLTAGHDSRMMLIESKKYFSNFQVHSFWRKSKDLELTIAEKIASKAGIKLRVIEGQHQLDKNNSELESTLKKSLYFYDGHIRMHCFLMEDYHTIEHRTAILGDKYLGMNGIGGEQYRNEWHMEMPFWSINYFVKYALTYHLCGQCFTDQKVESAYFVYLKSKLLRKLGLPEDAKSISKKYVQKYYNELYVASLMGVRTNAENALGHFITPFIDRQLTRASYKALKHHGISFEFQQAMIRKMDPELATVQSGYGYSFSEGEPLKNKIKYLVKEFTPVNMYQQRLNKKFESSGNEGFKQYLSKYKIFSDSVQFIQGFKLPLKEEVFTSRPDIMPVYLSLAFFLYFLNKEGKLDVNQQSS